MKPIYSGHSRGTEPTQVVHLNQIFDIRFHYCGALRDTRAGRGTDDERKATCKACIAALDARLAKYDAENK